MSPHDRLSRLDAAQLGTVLSDENARAGWAAAVQCAREMGLDRVIHGEPPRCITLVASANVSTAPLEWAWALSVRGVKAVLKSALAAVIPGVEHHEWRGSRPEQAAFAESDALYDGRGCMSPAAVFVHGVPDLEAMATAMAHAQVA